MSKAPRLNWKFPILPVLIDLGTDPQTYERRSGKTKIRCPFHDDSRPSSVIDWDKQRFRCFVCGIYGDAVDLYQSQEGLGREAARDRAESVTGLSHTGVSQASGDISLFD